MDAFAPGVGPTGLDDQLGPSLVAAMRQPSLSAERERRIIERAQGGDIAARATLATAYTRLVVRLARGFSGRGLTLADLVQEGMIGLTEAISRFDVARGCRFSTYSVFRIRRAMLAAIAASDLIRVPADARRELAAVRAAEQRRRGRGEPLDAFLVASDASVSTARVEQLRSCATVVASLDAPLGESTGTLADIVPDIDAELAEDSALDRVLHHGLRARLRTLDARTRTVIVLRYGLAGDVPWEHARLGARLGIGPERSRQLEQAGLRRLRIALGVQIPVSHQHQESDQ